MKAEIVRAPRVEVVPTNPGDTMASSLELNGQIIRDELDRLRGQQVMNEGLKPAQLGHLNALTQSLTRTERSLRQWRELKKREAADLSEGELVELMPRALEAMGVSAATVQLVLEEIAAAK